MADRVTLGIKVSQDLKKLIDMYLDTDPTYVNISEFARSAFREKIKKDTPWLYEKISRPDKSPTN
ncbi:unnamed protein product [marine sediment metagenome]|uniref:Ribbon-helix-helix protein CopG domain-containing protein n=1 Tax=marine sediment metagenome TaxID=412755 RepID=X1CEL3_9ZZZZ